MTASDHTSRGQHLSRRVVRIGLASAFGLLYGLAFLVVTETWGAPTLTSSTYAFGAGFLLSIMILLPLHARLEALLASRSDPLQHALQSFLAEMAASNDFPHLVGRALEIVTGELGIARASLFLTPPGARDLMLVETRGERPERERIAIDDPVVEILATLHVELSRSALELSPRYAGMGALQTETFDVLGAETLFPIEAKRTLVGLLALGPSGARGLQPDELELLRVLAAELGLCVMRARDAERLRSEQLELERLTRGLPRAVAREVRAGRLPRDGGRRRQVALVTCRVQGLDSLVERLEPDEFQQALHAYHALATDEIAAHGGALAAADGATVSLVFGDPEPVVDHGRRAMRAAIRLIDAVQTLWAPWRQTPTDLGAGIGVASGPATVGFVTAGRRLEYQVIGSVKTAARRLASRAASGEILVTAPALATAGSEFRTEPLTGPDDRDRTVVHRLVLD